MPFYNSILLVCFASTRSDAYRSLVAEMLEVVVREDSFVIAVNDDGVW